MSENDFEGYEQPFFKYEVQACTLALGCIMALESATDDGWFIPPEGEEPRAGIRCHEIAHALGRILNFPVQNGWVGAITETHKGIEHSWLWTKPPPPEWTVEHIAKWDGNILDVWVMGGYPRVHLVSCHRAFFQLGLRYRPNLTPRDDVNFAFVDNLEAFFRAYMEKVAARTKASTP